MKLHTIIFLFFIAIFLLLLLSPFITIFTLIRLIIEDKKAKDIIKEFLFDISYSIDLLGNVVGKHFFTWILLKGEYYPFGNKYETISSVLGKNKLKNTLNQRGKLLANLLDLIDKNHCINSINNN